MPEDAAAKIYADPRYGLLVSRRLRFSLALTALVLIAYVAFMAAVAFRPALLAAPLSAGFVTPLGVPFGAAIIVGSWMLTGLYVYRANGEFDRRVVEVIGESAR